MLIYKGLELGFFRLYSPQPNISGEIKIDISQHKWG